MPRAYHNLDGLIRDVESARLATDAEGARRWTRWVDVVEWALDHLDGDGDDPQGDDSVSEDELEGDEPQLSLDHVPRDRGHAKGSRDLGTPASMLDRALDGLAGDERAQAVAELDALRRDAVAQPPGPRRVGGRAKAKK